MDAAWPGLAVEEQSVVQIAVLRRLLGPAPDGSAWVATVPRVGYRFAGALKVHGEASGLQPASRTRTSMVVIPFENVGGDPERDYLVDGITDDIIVALARFRWFAVASRGTSFLQRKHEGLKDHWTRTRDGIPARGERAIVRLSSAGLRPTSPGGKRNDRLVRTV